MKLSIAEASIMSRFFSAGVFRELEDSSKSTLLSRLLQSSSLMQKCDEAESVGIALDKAFRALRLSDMRNDYIFRTALIERILLGRHTLNTASVLHEFRVSRSIADLVILNGTSTAYEIKSDRDKLDRLPSQLADFRKHFSRVVVVVSEKHLKEVEKLATPDVGILTLTRNFNLRTIKEPMDRPDLIDPASLIDAVRVSEAKLVLRRLGEEVPEVPNTLLRTVLREKVEPLDPVVVHNATIPVVAKCRSQAALGKFIENLPISLHSVALARNPKLQGQHHVKSAVSMPLGEVLSWR